MDRGLNAVRAQVRNTLCGFLNARRENRTHSGFPCAAANVSVVTEITGRISIRRGVSAFKQPVSVFRE